MPAPSTSPCTADRKRRATISTSTTSQRDLWETYLPAFKVLVQQAGVKEVMCAYQRFEGEPCCGSNRLLQQILRDEWGFRGLVVSDCGAISDFWRKGRHEVSESPAAAAAKGVASPAPALSAEANTGTCRRL